ncbi:MAG: hypothetical protein J6L90_00770 [Clostridia bacterium]|nr:hypothetical protein [Clostridia bacterium]
MQPPTVCVAYTAGVNPRPTGADADRVRSVHGGRDPDAMRRPTGSTAGFALRSG